MDPTLGEVGHRAREVVDPTERHLADLGRGRCRGKVARLVKPKDEVERRTEIVVGLEVHPGKAVDLEVQAGFLSQLPHRRLVR
jgi:hypothetical protein